MFANLSKIWENTYGCADQYRCAIASYLMSTLTYAYDIIVDHDVGALGHGRDILEGHNCTEKRCISMLMTDI